MPNQESILKAAYAATKDVKASVVTNAYSRYCDSMLKYGLAPRSLKDLLGLR